MEIKKVIALVILALVALGAMWFIFSPQPEKYSQNPSIGASSTPDASNRSGMAGNTYSNETFGFSVAVPDGFTVDESYLNQDLGPGREIPGVAFRIPSSIATGTNLSADSRVAVEELSDVDCTPADFLDQPSAGVAVALGGNSFVMATSSDAGAGNRYDLTVYVTQKGDRCYAVRYFIHSGNIDNYPPGAVQAFDRASLVSVFDSLAASLKLY